MGQPWQRYRCTWPTCAEPDTPLWYYGTACKIILTKTSSGSGGMNFSIRSTNNYITVKWASFLISFLAFLTPLRAALHISFCVFDLSNPIVRSFLALRFDPLHSELDCIIFKINPFNSVCFYKVEITVSGFVFSRSFQPLPFVTNLIQIYSLIVYYLNICWTLI